MLPQTGLGVLLNMYEHFLIPYTWYRHLQFGIWSALCCLIAWWFYLLTLTQGGMVWTAGWDAFVTNGLMASAVVFGNIWGEAALPRWTMRRRIWKVLLGVGVALGVSLFMTWMWAAVVALSLEDIGSVHHVVALKYRWGNLVGTGFAAAMGMLTAEKWRARPKSFVMNYVLGGLFAGTHRRGVVVYICLLLGSEPILAGRRRPVRQFWLCFWIVDSNHSG